ncbi:MAG: alpha/beta hydrolase [Alphaproteobacteria bacterium]|nr:alpha/beta hydrolase [Alphaproteobacteria bacterium]
MTEFLFNGPKNAGKTVALAHGAGESMDSEFMEFFATGLAEQGLRVARFEFPYMIKRREDGKRRPPDRAPLLLETYLNIAAELGPENLIVGGKSMGGRIASMIADEAGVAGLVCLGYPFHPPGKPDKLRTEHLAELKTPSLILQGERDPFGKRDEVAGYALSKSIKVGCVPDGDHDLKPRKASGRTRAENWMDAVDRMAVFIGGL